MADYSDAIAAPDSGSRPSSGVVDLSVVIPVHNGMPHFPAQVAALTRQTYSGCWEVIISDNGSTDESVEVARAAADRLALRVVDARKALGAAGARAIGARAARGRLLLFCDADDVVADDWVDRMAAGLKQYPAVGGRIDDASLNSESVRSWRPQGPGGFQRPFGLLPFAGAGNCGVQREVYEQVGGFEPDVADAAAEIEFFARVQLAGHELAYIPDAVIAYRHRPDLRSLMRQFRNYGQAQPRVVAYYQSLGLLPAGSWRDVAATTMWLAVHAVDVMRGTRRRGNYLRTLAFAIGEAEGSLQQGVLHVSIRPSSRSRGHLRSDEIARRGGDSDGEFDRGSGGLRPQS